MVFAARAADPGLVMATSAHVHCPREKRAHATTTGESDAAGPPFVWGDVLPPKRERVFPHLTRHHDAAVGVVCVTPVINVTGSGHAARARRGSPAPPRRARYSARAARRRWRRCPAARRPLV